ncbi:cellulose biosynthesis cyclic di-GMP-binding regulatory protein BcsB, partial [Rivularia sp. UHCC 0363]|uniref:cellulose biosynthesis cyclic di-GMP-binding regulatory protein BcsB n=1 Tax=Rivularia sp. UHCC 0363 TaxID=3110244 RepID=UPI002B1FD63D
MKRLFYFQASTKIFIIFCLLSPYSLLDAQALERGQKESLISQANPGDADKEIILTEANSTKSVNSEKNITTYNLEFNRAPIEGKKIRLRGISSEGSIDFTRPRNWDVASVKALIRFKHSTALYANRSNLTVLVNDTAVGSIPLDRKQSQLGQLLVDIPPSLLRDYNELKIIAQQRNAEVCVDPYDPSLWTEIQPDSKLVFNYKLKKASENFSRYPYPIIDELDLK